MEPPPDDAWDAARRVLQQSEERARIADVLWASGCRASAVSLAMESLRQAVEDLQGALGADEASPRVFLQSLGLSAADARALEGTLAASSSLPAHDGEVAPFDGQLLCATRHGLAALRRAVGVGTRSAAELRRARARTALGRLAVVAGLVAAVVFGYRPSEDPPVAATAYRVDGLDAWPPENAVDGDEMTYWQLPPGQAGALVVGVDPPRPVRRVRILNGHDLHADDRNRKDRRRFGYAAKTIRVLARRAGETVAEARAELQPVRDFEWTTVELPEHRALADEIRVEIEDWYGNGGGLAEVFVE